MVVKILISLILLYIFIFEIISILQGDTTLNVFEKKKTLKFFHILCIIIFVATFFNFLYSIYTFNENLNKKSLQGDRGIKGSPGDKGNKGKCMKNCGSTTCYNISIESINKFIKNHPEFDEQKYSITTDLLKNIEFKNKIKNICFSNAYQEILKNENKKKPTEKKLIEFINNTLKTWINLIMNNSKGSEYLLTLEPNYKRHFPKSENPFDEIEKYDIFSWENNSSIVKPIIKKECNLKEYLPKSDDPDIKLILSNRYKTIYISKVKKNIYGPKDKCKSNQLGILRDNPNNKKVCIGDDPNNIKYYNIFPEQSYNKPRELSLYHPQEYTDINGQIFYPIGSVWHGSLETKKPSDSIIIPSSNSSCDNTSEGPSKPTILVSGNIKNPIGYNLIWYSKNSNGCVKCQKDENLYDASIWRPIPPKDYISMGDVVINGPEKPPLDYVKCIHKSCLEEAPSNLGSEIWDSSELFYSQFDNYENFKKDIPIDFQQSKK